MELWVFFGVGIFSFLVSLTLVPFWKRKARSVGLIGPDKHKPGRKVAELGGVPVIAAFMLSMLGFVGLRVFTHRSDDGSLVYILAMLLSVSIASMIGLVDDILGWKIGLRRGVKALLTFSIALPIMVVNAGQSKMTFPVLGTVDLGLLYPLLIIPVGVMFSANAFNMLAGYNGLEAGQGILLLTGLGAIAYFAGSYNASAVAFAMVAALLAFYLYNRYPASVFPGDTLTYSVGALVAIIAILGNIERYAIAAFGLYYVQFLLKARGRMEKESFARPQAGALRLPYRKIYAIEHAAIAVLSRFRRNVSERDVVSLIHFCQLLIMCAVLLDFFV